MLRRLAAKRVQKDLEARLGLFGLDADEKPVESLRVGAAAVHPLILHGRMAPLETLESVDIDETVHRLGFVPTVIASLLLVTTKAIRWRPVRAYRGRLTEPNLDFLERPLPVLEQMGARPPKRFPSEPRYLPYDVDALAERYTPLSYVKRVDVFASQPGDRAYPDTIRVVQKAGTPRVDPRWPAFDINAFLTDDFEASLQAAMRPRAGAVRNPLDDRDPDHCPMYEFVLAGAAEVMVNEITLALAAVGVEAVLDESLGYLRSRMEHNRREPWAPIHERHGA